MQTFIHPQAGHVSVIELKRETGRTIRMFKAALDAVKNGHKVFVMMTPVEALAYAEQKPFCDETHLIIRSYVHVHEYNWETLTMGGQYTTYKVFIDHGVFEHKFRKLLGMWHEYDDCDPIIINNRLLGVSYNHDLMPASQVTVHGIIQNLPPVKTEYPRKGEPIRLHIERAVTDRRQTTRRQPVIPPIDGFDDLSVTTDLTTDVPSPGLRIVHK